jgi:hypothetical protein
MLYLLKYNSNVYKLKCTEAVEEKISVEKILKLVPQMLFLSENATFICGGTVCKCKSYGSG